VKPRARHTLHGRCPTRLNSLATPTPRAARTRLPRPPVCPTVLSVCTKCFRTNKLCGRPPQYAPAPISWPLIFWPWKWCPRHLCDVGYLSANFSLPRPLCSRLRPDVRDRQTSDTHHRLMSPPYGGGGITKLKPRVAKFCTHDDLVAPDVAMILAKRYLVFASLPNSVANTLFVIRSNSELGPNTKSLR